MFRRSQPAIQSDDSARIQGPCEGKSKTVIRVQFAEPGPMKVVSHIDYEIEDPLV